MTGAQGYRADETRLIEELLEPKWLRSVESILILRSTLESLSNTRFHNATLKSLTLNLAPRKGNGGGSKTRQDKAVAATAV